MKNSVSTVKLDTLDLTITAPADQSLPASGAPKTKKSDSVWVVFTTTFITIFLAEIGDKTQLSTLLMSAQSHAPWLVFLGAGAALVTTSLLGVLLGGFIASRLSPKTVEKSAGLVLLLVSSMLFWDVIHG